MTVLLTLLIVWLVTMPVAYGIVLAFYPPYLRRRASKRLQERSTPVSELDAFRARRSSTAGVSHRSLSR